MLSLLREAGLHPGAGELDAQVYLRVARGAVRAAPDVPLGRRGHRATAVPLPALRPPVARLSGSAVSGSNSLAAASGGSPRAPGVLGAAVALPDARDPAFEHDLRTVLLGWPMTSAGWFVRRAIQDDHPRLVTPTRKAMVQHRLAAVAKLPDR